MKGIFGGKVYFQFWLKIILKLIGKKHLKEIRGSLKIVKVSLC